MCILFIDRLSRRMYRTYVPSRLSYCNYRITLSVAIEEKTRVVLTNYERDEERSSLFRCQDFQPLEMG